MEPGEGREKGERGGDEHASLRVRYRAVARPKRTVVPPWNGGTAMTPPQAGHREGG
jgi:hypothetical protein